MTVEIPSDYTRTAYLNKQPNSRILPPLSLSLSLSLSPFLSLSLLTHMLQGYLTQAIARPFHPVEVKLNAVWLLQSDVENVKSSLKHTA